MLRISYNLVNQNQHLLNTSLVNEYLQVILTHPTFLILIILSLCNLYCPWSSLSLSPSHPVLVSKMLASVPIDLILNESTVNANQMRNCCSVARNADGSPWKASTWWRRPVSGMVEVLSVMWRVAVAAAAATPPAEAAEYHPDCLSRWDIGKLVKSTHSTSSPLANRIAPNGYALYALVSLPLPSHLSFPLVTRMTVEWVFQCPIFGK